MYVHLHIHIHHSTHAHKHIHTYVCYVCMYISAGDPGALINTIDTFCVSMFIRMTFDVSHVHFIVYTSDTYVCRIINVVGAYAVKELKKYLGFQEFQL